MQQQSQMQQATTLTQKMEFTAALALFPAMTIMVFLYRKLGYRFLSPIKLLIMAVLLIAFGTVVGMQVPFIVFAIAMLALGLIERRFRWTDLTQGVAWHTYSRGVPLLRLIPGFNVRESWVRRYITPALAAGIGIIIAIFFRYLGLYILFAAVCLLIFESYDYDRNLNRQLDMMDSLVESEFASQDIEFFSQGNPFEKPVEETGGIPTGVSPELNAAIAKRRSNVSTQPRWQQQSPGSGQPGGAQPVAP